ncbi:hypothetical protein TURU_048625 [Turdus rufiventris]|nr:hypothetical protein TURU_048625 [Turdus rufiventris]
MWNRPHSWHQNIGKNVDYSRSKPEQGTGDREFQTLWIWDIPRTAIPRPSRGWLGEHNDDDDDDDDDDDNDEPPSPNSKIQNQHIPRFPVLWNISSSHPLEFTIPNGKSQEERDDDEDDEDEEPLSPNSRIQNQDIPRLLPDFQFFGNFPHPTFWNPQFPVGKARKRGR